MMKVAAKPTGQGVLFTLLTILILALGSSPAKGAAYLAFTNQVYVFSKTNWNGAFDANRPFIVSSGDSITAGYREPPGAISVPTPEMIAILASQADTRVTNVAVPGEYFREYYPKATNVMTIRQPRVLIFGSPANDCVEWVNFPLDMWDAHLMTNNLLVAKAREFGVRIVYQELIPRSSDYYQLITNWNAELREWAGRSTNSDVVTVGRVWDVLKDPGDPNVMLPAYTSDGLHNTPLGHTNFCLALLTNVIEALTIDPATPGMSDVSNAVHHLVANGDTLQLPAGTATWTNQLTTYKSMTIKGYPNYGTTIRDGRITYGQYMIRVELTNARTTRITGILWNDNGGLSDATRLFMVHGTDLDNRRFRFDHNAVLFYKPIGLFDTYGIYGVIDHNTIITTNKQAFLGEILGSSYGYTQGAPAWGDGAWTNTLGFSTERFLFFEDNKITNLHTTTLTMIDGHSGTRYVFRHNDVDGGTCEIHGAEASRTRSGYAYEIYKNNLSATGVRDGTRATPGYFRGGVGRFYSNNISGFTTAANIALLDNKAIENLNYPFNGSDGRNGWDKNNAGNPQVTGTVTSSGALSLTDNTKNWTNNFWAGFTVRKTSGKTISGIVNDGFTATVSCTAHGFSTSGNGEGYVTISGANEYGYNGTHAITVVNPNSFTFSLQFLATPATPATGTMFCSYSNSFAIIEANTSDTITFNTASFNPADFVVGDTYEINKVTQSMDQIGVTNAINTGDLGGANYPSVWSNPQFASPWYEWNNTREGGADVDFNNGYQGGTFETIVSGVNFVDDTVPPGWSGGYTYPHWLVTQGNLGSTDGGDIPPDPTSSGPRVIHGGSRVEISGKTEHR